MKHRTSKSRRDFLKTSMLGAANVMASGIIAKSLKASQTLPFKQINKNIDNLRVVCCHDPEMVTDDPTNWDNIADQNEYVVVERVQNNLDCMAMSLAQKPTPEEAWSTIFTIPTKTEWREARAAIKANCKTNSGRHSNNPRLAVLDKICVELNRLGIPYENIVIYDGDDEEASKPYKSYIGNGLPDGIIVSRRNDALGGTTQATVPDPWNKSGDCTKDIANGDIDILVNCTVNKGSHSWTGPATLCIKNHMGTFKASSSLHDLDYLIGISKSDAIVGGTPPRQQLCIVDSLWASNTGPAAVPNKAPYKLVMGTCAPVVDYLTIKRIREDDMGVSHNSSIVSKYLTEFGFSEDDVSDFIYVDPTSNKMNSKSVGSKKVATLWVTIPNISSNKTAISFDLTRHVRPIFINVRDLRGRTIQSLSLSTSSSGELHAFWNGRDGAGAVVGSGIYLITVRQNGRMMSKKIKLTR